MVEVPSSNLGVPTNTEFSGWFQMFQSLSTADWIGAFGVAILLLAFVLNLTGRLALNSKAYCALNALGAGIAGFASWLIDFWPFVVLESVWCAVSLFALFTQKPSTKKHPEQ